MSVYCSYEVTIAECLPTDATFSYLMHINILYCHFWFIIFLASKAYCCEVASVFALMKSFWFRADISMLISFNTSMYFALLAIIYLLNLPSKLLFGLLCPIFQCDKDMMYIVHKDHLRLI